LEEAMPLQLYNTLTRRKEPFVPRDPGRATMYTCGPTVYNYTHIGHLRPAMVADVLKRYLTRQGCTVYHVTNFTDVDDKIIARAREEGVSPAALSQRYIDDYLETMRRLGLDGVDRYVRVTDHMDDIVEMIRVLVDKGFAYPLDGDVYFDVTAKPDYGKLSGRSLDELQAGARVEVDPRKRHPMDFALWKAARPGDPAWPSPWGPGRPGWHIECSALSLRYLGPGFDIHGGGDDLIFPHHENEIAQSEAYGDRPFARYWLHNGMVQLGREKMSKSGGNFVPLRDLVDRYPAGAIRLFLLTTHYRKPLGYSDAALAEAARGWRRLETARRNLASRGHVLSGADLGPSGEGVAAGDGSDPWDEAPAPRTASQVLAQIETAAASTAPEAFAAAMDDDLNTAGALAALFDLVRAVNAGLNHPDVAPDAPALRLAAETLEDLGGTLGLWAGAERGAEPAGARGGLVEGLVELLLDVRSKAREARDWPTADRIRDRLGELGIAVEDTPQGTRWKVEDSA
jgi:cysteinyl-tRNA synthetase